MSSSDILPDVLELFTSSLLTCHVSARVMRLQCLSRLAASFRPGDPAQSSFLPSATLEVVLCTKDSNGRTRELAYNVLVLLAVARGNPADAVRTVVGGLAATTPHARSAAVLALGRLQLEFGHFRSERWDARVADMVPDLTRTMLLLLKEPSREVVKAVLGWLRVAVGGADREVLRPLIGDIVLGVMSGTTPRHKVREENMHCMLQPELDCLGTSTCSVLRNRVFLTRQRDERECAFEAHVRPREAALAHSEIRYDARSSVGRSGRRESLSRDMPGRYFEAPLHGRTREFSHNHGIDAR